MKFIISILLIATLSFVAGMFLPWWVIAIIGFGVAILIKQQAAVSFLAGFTALFLLWGGLSFYISNANNNLFAHKISMLVLQIDNPVYIILVTALIGALVAGLGSLTGSFVHSKNK